MKKKKDSKEKLVAALALVSLLFLMYVALRNVRPAAARLSESDLIITDIKAAPIEYQLAYLDSGQLPRGTDIKAARIRYLLESLAGKTGDNAHHIAERTPAATESLKREYGREITHQRFLEEANNYNGPKMDYDSLSTLLVADLGR